MFHYAQILSLGRQSIKSEFQQNMTAQLCFLSVLPTPHFAHLYSSLLLQKIIQYLFFPLAEEWLRYSSVHILLTFLSLSLSFLFCISRSDTCWQLQLALNEHTCDLAPVIRRSQRQKKGEEGWDRKVKREKDDVTVVAAADETDVIRPSCFGQDNGKMRCCCCCCCGKSVLLQNKQPVLCCWSSTTRTRSSSQHAEIEMRQSNSWHVSINKAPLCKHTHTDTQSSRHTNKQSGRLKDTETAFSSPVIWHVKLALSSLAAHRCRRRKEETAAIRWRWRWKKQKKKNKSLNQCTRLHAANLAGRQVAKTKQRQEGAKVEEVRKTKICRQLVSSVTTKLLQREREHGAARWSIDQLSACIIGRKEFGLPPVIDWESAEERKREKGENWCYRCCCWRRDDKAD